MLANNGPCSRKLRLPKLCFGPSWFWPKLVLAQVGFGRRWVWPKLVLAHVGFGPSWFGPELVWAKVGFGRSLVWPEPFRALSLVSNIGGRKPEKGGRENCRPSAQEQTSIPDRPTGRLLSAISSGTVNAKWEERALQLCLKRDCRAHRGVRDCHRGGLDRC